MSSITITTRVVEKLCKKIQTKHWPCTPAADSLARRLSKDMDSLLGKFRKSKSPEPVCRKANKQ